MADITHLLGGAFTPPPPRPDLPPAEQLIEAIRALGIDPPSSVYLDGRLHRFRSQPGKSKDGWYVAYGDGVPAGAFGCWRLGVESTWRAEIDHRMTPAEELAHAKRMQEARALRDAEVAQRHGVAASVVAMIWDSLAEAPADHPYLVRKGIKPNGARVTGDGRLCVPLFDEAGSLTSLQYIDADGGKLYHSGGATSGASHLLGTLDSVGPVYVAEGFATAATVHEVTGRPVLVAYSASNLVPVVGQLVEQGQTQIVVVADNDKSGVGQRYAEQAAAKHGCRWVVPPILGDANDYVQAGKDLAALLTPKASDWLISADDFSSQPAPISWLVKGWLQANALHMVHGPSGHGKTFVVLDWCCRMASGAADWFGARSKPGAVVYLAGEGHHGLRARVAAWKVRHGADRLAMWVSRDGCDLNTPAGLHRALEALRALPVRPSLVVVDTLHRFLSGDENSAQDAKTMLDACAVVMGEFGCSVLLVHHTGVSEEAQGRARGSSAWRGALDIEINVFCKDGQITVSQKKCKDAEQAQPVYAELEPVALPGWVDEDGEPVGSVVLRQCEAPAETRKPSKLEEHRKTLERAWFDSGAETRSGLPYVARAPLRAFLLRAMGWAASTVDQHLKPSADGGRLIRALLDGGFITPHEHGWQITDPVHASRLMLARDAERQ